MRHRYKFDVGNNGGDGFVAARHLKMMGYDVVIVVPKRSAREPHYSKLISQCVGVGVDVLDAMPDCNEDQFDIAVDAIFGFSFRGEPREPFASILNNLSAMKTNKGTVLVSVDVPSGWDVDRGDVYEIGMEPDALISLTAPKKCAALFCGRHFIGGRFLPPELATKYGIEMPPYTGITQVMEIGKNVKMSDALLQSKERDDWGIQYQKYLEEKDNDNLTGNTTSPNQKEEDWAVQYARHIKEKENED